MQATIEIGGGLLNSGVNGVMLRNCSVSSGETAASQSYVQNFRRNLKLDVPELNGFEILAAFRSRSNSAIYLITFGDDEKNEFMFWRKASAEAPLYALFNGKKIAIPVGANQINFSCDYAKLNRFRDFDCIVVCAFGVLLAFDEFFYRLETIETKDMFSSSPSGICAFANRLVATAENDDQYYWSELLTGRFNMSRAEPDADGNPLPSGAGFASTEYGNDKTKAARRIGSRLAIFTSRTIEMKDISMDTEMPFAGYLYRNNHDIGAVIETIRDIDGICYFVGEEGNSQRHIYALSDGGARKLTNANQSKLLHGSFTGSGTFQEDGRTFYIAYGSRSMGIDIASGSLFEIDRDGHYLELIDYMRQGNSVLRIGKSGFYLDTPGSDQYVGGKIRLPIYDFGAAANITKISFIGEFLESLPAVATLTAERGFAQTAISHKRGFDFFLLGLQKLNDLEFSVSANFRLTRITIDYQILKNGNFYGVG